MRKKLSVTQREIVIDKDKSKCHRELLRQSRIYPFDVYCPNCSKAMKYEDEIIFYKKSEVDKFVERLVSKMDKDKRAILLNEYDNAKRTEGLIYQAPTR